MPTIHQRRGTLYLAVLGVSVVVSTLALAGMHAARTQLAAATNGADRVEARLMAQSGIELGVARLNSNPSWRTVFSVDTDYPVVPVAAGRGTFTWRLTSAGGLNRTLSGTGTVGAATCTLTVDLAQPPDLDCALLAEGDISVASGCELTVEDAPIGTNGQYDNQGATYGDLEAQSSSGSSINGTETVPGSQRVLPMASMVLDYYQHQGTNLPLVGFGNKTLSGTVLSPNTNFYGSTNADGIYLVDAGQMNVIFNGCRIVGTIVVTNLGAGNKVTIAGDVNWEPAYPNYPALIVDGDLDIDGYTDGLVTENWFAPSLNPVGTPYQGSADTDKDDDFYSSIAGIVYCTGNLRILGDGSTEHYPDLRGIFLAGGSCSVESLTLPVIKYDDTFSTTPPPGFDQTDPVVIVPGSLR